MSQIILEFYFDPVTFTQSGNWASAPISTPSESAINMVEQVALPGPFQMNSGYKFLMQKYRMELLGLPGARRAYNATSIGRDDLSFELYMNSTSGILNYIRFPEYEEWQMMEDRLFYFNSPPLETLKLRTSGGLVGLDLDLKDFNFSAFPLTDIIPRVTLVGESLQ